jgi:L-rhamnono-1,4-lactonase
MAPQKLLDTHIHLWPSTALSPTDHAWMKPGHKLAQLHGIDDYKTTISSSPIQPTGFVYVETDRYLPSFVPSISPAENEGGDENTEVCTEKLKIWAKEPLNELKFLRRIVGEAPQEGDGFVAGEGEKLKGMVVWAPFHLSAKLFAAYLDIAKESLGERAWDRVVGFRYLLQGSGVDGVRSVVDSEGFMANLVMIGGLGGGDGRGKVKAFDVGIDCHGDGVEALEIVVGLIEKVRGMSGGKEVRFILSKSCLSSILYLFYV